MDFADLQQPAVSRSRLSLHKQLPVVNSTLSSFYNGPPQAYVPVHTVSAGKDGGSDADPPVYNDGEKADVDGAHADKPAAESSGGDGDGGKGTADGGCGGAAGGKQSPSHITAYSTWNVSIVALVLKV